MYRGGEQKQDESAVQRRTSSVSFYFLPKYLSFSKRKLVGTTSHVVNSRDSLIIKNKRGTHSTILSIVVLVVYI